MLSILFERQEKPAVSISTETKAANTMHQDDATIIRHAPTGADGSEGTILYDRARMIYLRGRSRQRLFRASAII